MATKITIELPDRLYQETQEFARLHQVEMEAAISALIEHGLVTADVEPELTVLPSSNSVAERERMAYIAQHGVLKEKYLGQYVAIYHGMLIDHDIDAATLSERVRSRYPNEFVLVTLVRQEPIRTIDVRSPRVARD